MVGGAVGQGHVVAANLAAGVGEVGVEEEAWGLDGAGAEEDGLAALAAGEAGGVVGEAGEADAVEGAGVGDVEAGELGADVLKPELHLGGGEGVGGLAEVERAEWTAAQLALLGFEEDGEAEAGGKGEEGDAVGAVGGGVE